MEKQNSPDTSSANYAPPAVVETWLEFDDQPGTAPLMIGKGNQLRSRRTGGMAIHAMRATDDPESPIVVAV